LKPWSTAEIALFVSISAVAAAYREAAWQPFKNMGADLIVQRGASQMESGGTPAKSMRGILLPFSNQVFEPGELSALKQLPGENAHALILWEFAPKGFRTIMGVDVGQPSIGAVKVKEWVKEGRFPKNSDEIALEKHFARFQKIVLGNMFQLGEKTFTVTGMIEIIEGPQVAAANIYTTLDSAGALLKGKPDSVNLFYLKLEDPARLNSVSIGQQFRLFSRTHGRGFHDIGKIFFYSFHGRACRCRAFNHENHGLPSVGTKKRNRHLESPWLDPSGSPAAIDGRSVYPGRFRWNPGGLPGISDLLFHGISLHFNSPAMGTEPGPGNSQIATRVNIPPEKPVRIADNLKP